MVLGLGHRSPKEVANAFGAGFKRIVHRCSPVLLGFSDRVHQIETIRRPACSVGKLLFLTKAGTPISRNTFRTRIWLPAVKASGVDFPLRVHDLRHAHASWLLAGGADLVSVMDRMSHSQIQTTQK